MFSTWLNVLTHPGEPVFAEERAKPSATLGTAIIWMAIAAVIVGIVAVIRGFIFRNQLQAAGGIQGILSSLNLPTEFMSQIDPAVMDQVVAPRTTAAILTGGFWAVVGTILGFLIGVGILFLIAKVFGGTGEFGRYSYLIAAFAAPIMIVSSLLGLIPVVGGCIGFLLWIYEIGLAYFATKVEHNLTQGKAIAVILLPIALIILLAICGVVALGGLAAAIFSGNQ